MTTLVLLPGLDGTGRLFQPLLGELPADWRALAVCYPADATMGYDELARFVEASLPADGPLVLLGESFSGPIAIRLTASLGLRVQALVLCCSFARSPRVLLRGAAGFIGWLPSPARLPSALAARVLLGAGAPAASRVLLARVLAGLSAEVLHARLRMVADVNVERELAAVRVPVLYLQASSDHLVPASVARDVQRTLPTVSVVRLAGGHGLLQAAPSASAATIVSFLSGP